MFKRSVYCSKIHHKPDPRIYFHNIARVVFSTSHQPDHTNNKCHYTPDAHCYLYNRKFVPVRPQTCELSNNLGRTIGIFASLFLPTPFCTVTNAKYRIIHQLGAAVLRQRSSRNQSHHSQALTSLPRHEVPRRQG